MIENNWKFSLLVRAVARSMWGMAGSMWSMAGCGAGRRTGASRR